MFGISGLELLVIIAFILIIFGPERLPEIARTIGKAMRAFKTAQEDMERLIKVEMLTEHKPAATTAGGLTPEERAAAGVAKQQEAKAAAAAAAATPAASAVVSDPASAAPEVTGDHRAQAQAAESVWDITSDDGDDEEDEE